MHALRRYWGVVLTVVLILGLVGFVTLRYFGESRTLARELGTNADCSKAGTALVAGVSKMVYRCTYEGDDHYGCYALVDGDAYRLHAWEDEGGRCLPPQLRR